jgi:hypothetical protein
MDATPDTLQFAERVRFTYEAAGGGQAETVKFIVILRDPVFRELSLYNHMAFEYRLIGENDRNEWNREVAKEDGSVMSFEEFVLEKSIPALGQATGPGRSTRHSLYATHLSKWFELFDRKQILVLSYDELQRQPEKLQERIQNFLGHTITGELKRANSNDNKYKVHLPSRKAKEALNAVFTPLNEELYQLLESNPGPYMEQRPFPRFQQPNA